MSSRSGLGLALSWLGSGTEVDGTVFQMCWCKDRVWGAPLSRARRKIPTCPSMVPARMPRSPLGAVRLRPALWPTCAHTHCTKCEKLLFVQPVVGLVVAANGRPSACVVHVARRGWPAAGQPWPALPPGIKELCVTFRGHYAEIGAHTYSSVPVWGPGHCPVRPCRGVRCTLAFCTTVRLRSGSHARARSSVLVCGNVSCFGANNMLFLLRASGAPLQPFPP